MYKLCKNTGAVILQTLDPPSDERDIENDLPDAILDIAISLQNCEYPINMFETKIKTAHTEDTIWNQLRNIYSIYTCAAGMLLHINGKFTMGKLKSSLFGISWN
jgi:hypothetical protein